MAYRVVRRIDARLFVALLNQDALVHSPLRVRSRAANEVRSPRILGSDVWHVSPDRPHIDSVPTLGCSRFEIPRQRQLNLGLGRRPIEKHQLALARAPWLQNLARRCVFAVHA